MSDEERIRRILSGETELFEVLDVRVRKRAFACAYRILHDPADAGVVAADAVSKAYENLAGFDLKQRFEPWVVGFARNLAFRRRRDRNYHCHPESLDQIDPELGPSCPGPEEEHARLVSNERLWKRLSKLKNRVQRLAVYYRVCLQMPYKEMAEKLHRSPLTLASYVHRGLATLRRMGK